MLGKVRPSAKHWGVMASAHATAAVYSMRSVMRSMPPTEADERECGTSRSNVRKRCYGGEMKQDIELLCTIKQIKNVLPA